MAEQDGPTVEERLEALEQLLERAIAAARRHPMGRTILRTLGIR
jgi:hypothetical protein